MDSSSSWVDTLLDLNASGSRSLRLETTKKEPTSNLIVFGRKLSVKEESGALVEELNRVSAENKKLTEMLTAMCESYNALQSQLMDLMSKNNSSISPHHHHHQAISYKELSPSRKRKSEISINNDNNNINNFRIMNGNNNNSESSSTDEESSKKPRSEEIIKAKISRVYVRTEASDTTLVVKDGYQWRKYGQKVTRDNPSPRAYFKCSYAPSCPVKKKVQRSVEDQAVVVATYEGEHNHLPPSQMEATSGSNRTVNLGSVPAASASAAAAAAAACSATLNSCGPTITLDLTTSNKSTVTTTEHEAAAAAATNSSCNPKMDQSSSSSPPQVRQFLVEQMASSLTKDPNFTAALAAAISGRMFSAKSN